jgi:histone deacetylase 1/2
MQMNCSFLAAPEDIRRFHSDDYVDFLSSVSTEILSENSHTHYRQLKQFNVGEDCPVFNGLLPFFHASDGESTVAAVRPNRGDAGIAINWCGGLHHAKNAEASGFCYANDIFLGTLELLEVHRVFIFLYLA